MTIESDDRDWLGKVAGGTVVRVERSLSRREGWLVDVERSDGSGRALFVRVARPGDPINSPETLVKEAELAGVLAAAEVRVAGLVGLSRQRNLAAYERLPGRSDITEIEPHEQQQVYLRFIEELGRLHCIDIDSLPMLDWYRPESARECALAGLDTLKSNYDTSVARASSTAIVNPLVDYGLRWLREHAATDLGRLSLVHGDAGTPNFLYEGDEITGIIDWEWARFGDPMEDLGNATLHAVFHPSGEWSELLAHYERTSGIPVDVERVAYWRAHLAVRSVIALGTATATWDAHDPIALNLCYRTVSDRICCECIAAPAGISLERPPLPWTSDARPTLYTAVAGILDTEIAPCLDTSFAQGRAREARLVVQALEREHQLRPLIDDVDLVELTELLGHRPTDVSTGLSELRDLIVDGPPDRDGTILRYLARRAWREERLLAPVVSLFPNLELRPLEKYPAVT
ncbi:MAG: phosphotransferase family protein [Actinobacteria bacterium]|nr:MAG: phosphotransferase family protein [Actinomycetota bacterium]